MSLIRHIALLIAVTLGLALAGSVAVNIHSTREALETQLRLKNSDNAVTLALALSQQKGDAGRMAALAAAQFDTGFYRRIRLVDAGGKALFERDAGPVELGAPDWFVALTPIASVPGMGQVSDGWRVIGTVEVESQTAFVHRELWHGSRWAALALALVGLLAGTLGALFVARLRRPLEATVQQARALERGEYPRIAEPRIPELRRMTRAMNSMVARLEHVFETQAAHVEAMRQQAQHDTLTGLVNRPHFMARLGALLDAENGANACGVVLLRVADLAEVNRGLGRETTDRMLRALAQALQTYARRVAGCTVGRINGSDFALALPVGGVALETAEALVELLRAVLPAFGSQVFVVAGVAEAGRGSSRATLMAACDLALTGAESRGAFAVEAGAAADVAVPPHGEAAWRAQVDGALAEGRLRLASFPVVDALQRTLHLECPLRLQLDPAGPYCVAAVWLPLVLRLRLTASVDERALALALADIERDGQARCVNVAPASLADSGFAPRLRSRLQAVPPAVAAGLWVEVAEVAAAERFELVRELGRQIRPTGARLGLEHAGERLGRIDRLFELGLDYVKLDAAVASGIAADADRAGFVASLVALLHGLSVQVMAEGVTDAGDAARLWACGVDGITGPWVGRWLAAPAEGEARG